MKIWLDDNLDNPDVPIRHTPEGWVGARNFAEFKALIEQVKQTGEKIEAIDFDNDLGVNEAGEIEMEGREILEWLAETHPEYVVGEGIELKSHSSNINANDAMREKIKFWQEHPKELLEAKNRPSPWDSLPEDTEFKNR